MVDAAILYVFLAVAILLSVWAVVHALQVRSGRELPRKPVINPGTQHPFDDIQ
jgi:hypothetical protein